MKWSCVGRWTVSAALPHSMQGLLRCSARLTERSVLQVYTLTLNPKPFVHPNWHGISSSPFVTGGLVHFLGFHSRGGSVPQLLLLGLGFDEGLGLVGTFCFDMLLQEPAVDP